MKSMSEGRNREMIHRSDFGSGALYVVGGVPDRGASSCGSGGGSGGEGGRMRHIRGPERRIVIGSRHGAHFSCTRPMWYPLPFTPIGGMSYSGVGPSLLSGEKAATIGITSLMNS